MDRDQFIELVRQRARVAGLPAAGRDIPDRRGDGETLVRTLRKAVTGDEFEDALAQLPREYTALLDESD